MDIFGIRKLVTFDKSDPKWTYTSLVSSIDTVTKKETNKEIMKAEEISAEAINRDLGFQDIIMKNSIYENNTNPLGITKGIMTSKTEMDKVIELFKKVYVRCLNRGYTQSQSRKIAKAEAEKYIDEEQNYYIKKWSI